MQTLHMKALTSFYIKKHDYNIIMDFCCMYNAKSIPSKFIDNYLGMKGYKLFNIQGNIFFYLQRCHLY